VSAAANATVRRRTFVAAAAAGAGLSGCLADPTGSSSTARKTAASPTARRTAEGIVATFRVVDGHEPTDDDAGASVEGESIIVRGTMDPSGCNRPVLRSVGAADGDAVRVVVGGRSPYETATPECGNASFDYRIVISTDGDGPSAVTLVHEYDGRPDRTFRLDRS
jgi:hypothetical protein